MAVIKCNDTFLREVDELRDSGIKLEEAIKKASVFGIRADEVSLPTVDAYQERLIKIWKVIYRLRILVEKDAQDIDALAGALKAADDSSAMP